MIIRLVLVIFLALWIFQILNFPVLCLLVLAEGGEDDGKEEGSSSKIKRQRLTGQQVAELETWFQKDIYPSTQVKKLLSSVYFLLIQCLLLRVVKISSNVLIFFLADDKYFSAHD